MALGWSLFALSWLLPNHYNPWVTFPAEAMAFIAIAALMTGILGSSGSSNLRWPAFALCTLAVALIPWIQWLLGISLFAGDALLGSYYLVGWAAAIVVGYHLGAQSGGQSVLALLHMLWIAALLSAMVGLLQWLKLDEGMGIYVAQTDIGDPVMGNLAQPNQLSTLLLMGMAAYSCIYERRIIGHATFALGIFFMTYILVLTHSRSGVVGVLAVGVFLLAKRSRIDSRLSAWQILAWMALFVLMSVASPFIDQALLLNVDREPLFTVNGRSQIWLQTIEGIKQSPWTGYGWNQTFSATSVGALIYPGVLIASYAHNVLLDVVAWNGLPIGLVLIGLGGYWFCTRLNRVTGIAGTYAMACLLPFTLHSMVELPFAYAYFLLAAGLLVGVVEATMATAKVWEVRRVWVGPALLIWIVAGIGIAYEYLLIEEDVRVTRFETLRVGTTDPSYRSPKIWLLTQMATLQQATRQKPVPHMDEQQLDAMRRAFIRFPNGGVALRYAMALGMNDDPSGARHTLAVIRGVYGKDFFTAARNVWTDQAEKNTELKGIDFPD